MHKLHTTNSFRFQGCTVSSILRASKKSDTVTMPNRKEIKPAALIIEIIRKQGNKQQTRRSLFLQNQVNQAESEKKQQEEATAENHRLRRIVRQHILKSVPVNSKFRPVEFPHNCCMI